jgi:hypothetical protein
MLIRFEACFELRLMLHFRDHTGFIDTATAESQSRYLENRPGKRIDAAVYLPHRQAAAARAAALTAKHDKDRTPFPKNNPSSTMYELLTAIERN